MFCNLVMAACWQHGLGNFFFQIFFSFLVATSARVDLD
jgi:hypothetical protein